MQSSFLSNMPVLDMFTESEPNYSLFALPALLLMTLTSTRSAWRRG